MTGARKIGLTVAVAELVISWALFMTYCRTHFGLPIAASGLLALAGGISGGMVLVGIWFGEEQAR